MLVTPIDHGLTYIGKSTGARSTGLHMSDLYNSYFQELDPKKYDKDRPMNPMHLELGLAWENMLEDGLKDRLSTARLNGEDISRPGEFVTDGGIAFSPDLLIYALKPPVRLGEIKLTWMSSREMPKEPQDFALPKKFRKWECVSPDTRILTSDLQYVRADSLQVGDSLLGFDEFGSPKRQFWHTKVRAVRTLLKPCARLTLSDGSTITCSTDHLWLSSTSLNEPLEWRRTDTLLQSDATHKPRTGHCYLARVMPSRFTVGPLSEYERGWLAGVFDGEGTLGNSRSLALSAAQVPGAIFDRVVELLTKGGFTFRVQRDVGGFSGRPILHAHLSTKNDIYRFLGSIRPVRLLNKFLRMDRLSTFMSERVQVVSREYLGVCPVLAIETDEHTFIAEGFASHNCQIMAYLYHLEMLDARLYSFHVNGEYAWMKRKPKAKTARDIVKKVVEETNEPGGPQLLAFNLEYTEIELGDNWLILENHGKAMGLLDARGHAKRRRKK